MTRDAKTPWYRDGRVVVGAFIGFCFMVALGSVLLTVYGYEVGPDEPRPKPPEIGHELVPERTD